MTGAHRSADGWQFVVWAPEKENVQLHIIAPFSRQYPMTKNEQGYFVVNVTTDELRIQYYFSPDGANEFPDPASMYQPDGVHGPSQTVDHAHFCWTDEKWKNPPFNELILYELHVGVFTEAGTFEAIIERLDELTQTGINAIELMPVTQFPGSRNWGYDGVFLYAVQNSYGGPEGLKKLVDACHKKGIAVLLDVVYNHVGPEGNVLAQFGPYFTKKYTTPWGEAINYDGPWSDGVREYFSDNITYWLEHFHIDGLRCDAIHEVFDNGAENFWELACQKIQASEKKCLRKFYMIAESDLNSPKITKQPSEGGCGFDAQWLDDLHHALYVFLNPADQQRYYDFNTIEQLGKAYTDGFVHSGQWVKFRKKNHGASSAGISGRKFIAFNLNHDQAGNRAGGERLSMLINFERLKLAAAAILLSPYIPMLFMGEEYGDDSPFYYFVSHSDATLIATVREGRAKDFKEFGSGGLFTDPQEENTFKACKLQWEKRRLGKHLLLLNWYTKLIAMRRTMAPLRNFEKSGVHVDIINAESFILTRRAQYSNEQLLCIFNLSENEVRYALPVGDKVLDSKAGTWLISQDDTPPKENTLAPLSVTVILQKN